MTTLVTAPVFPTLQPGEIVALSLENAGAGTLAAGIASFGQVFGQGDLIAGSSLVAMIRGEAVPVQIDVKTTWPDGSVKMAVLSIARPEMAAGQSLDVVLAAAPASAAPPVDLLAVAAGHSFTVDLAIVGRAPLSIDVLGALRTAMADGSATFWQQGPLATEARVQIPVDGTSMRLVFDVTAYANGEIAVSARFANDRAMEAVGGRLDYTVRIVMDGAEVARETVSQAQYQSWHRDFASGADGGQGAGDPAAGWLNIRHDIGYLQQTGAVPHYDLSFGVVESRLAGLAAEMEGPTWGDPLSNNGVTTAMPTTGGRADIGFTTAYNATWLMTGDARAAAYSLGQAEASGSVPWNMYDLANGTWLNTDNYPRLWVDGRGGTGRPGDPTSTGLTQQVAGDTGWEPDTAHQPNLNLVPYVLTGERWILDNLNAQAAWNVMNQWPAASRLPDGTDLVVNIVQTRSAAWSLREVEAAAWANPDGSVESAYFNSVSDENWSWLVSKIPEWTAMQGEAHGWLPTAYVSGFLDRVLPWQQDFFASTAIAAASRGNEDALTYLKWASNFLVGRFLNEANGFEMRDGITMNVAVGAQDRTQIYTTWREIGEQTEARNWHNGNDFWTGSINYNGQLALATLAGIWRLTGNEDAREAYLKLLAERPPYTGLESYQSDPTYAVALPGVIASPPPQIFPAPEFQPIADFLDLNGAALSVVLAGDAWNGAPIAAVLVNGIELWRGEVTAARGSAGQEIALGRVKTGGDYKVEVRFVNEATDFSSANDRNLYVMGVKVDGRLTGDERVLWGNGAYVAAVPVGNAGAVPDPVASIGAGPDVVRLALSGDAWREYPKYVVLVDGATVGGIREVTAAEARGQVEFLDVRGDFGGSHNITVRFLNDSYGGGPLYDRNLFVKAVSINGTDLQRTAALNDFGDATFLVSRPAGPAPAPTPAATSVGTGADVIRIALAQDAWLGNAQFHLLLNGTKIGDLFEVSALRSAGQTDLLELRGDFGTTANSVGIRFVNDAWGGSAAADRNLHVASVTLNGTEIGVPTTLGTNGTARFTFGTGPLPDTSPGTPTSPTSPTSPPPTPIPTGTPQTISIGSGPDLITLRIAQDAWWGNASYVVLVNGTQIGGTLEAGALRGSGQSDTVRVSVDLIDGANNMVTVRFINDLYGGSAELDRNLYVTSISVNGTDLGRTTNLFSNGDASFTIVAPPPSNEIAGNDNPNTIMGREGNDTILGLGGNDILYSFAGDDQMDGGAGIDFLAGGEGNDTLRGGLDPDQIFGEAGDDSIVGGPDFVFDLMVGGEGADTIDGRSGNGDFDYLYGGDGNDLFMVDTPDDLVFEFAGGGNDTVHADIVGAGYYLYAEIEDLVLLGATPFGVGNELANRLTGSDAPNWLLGGAGADTLNGKGGGDVLFGEGGADSFVFERGTGGDVIGDFVSGVDRIVLSGFDFANAASVLAAFKVVGGDSAINLGQGDFVVLVGVTSIAQSDIVLL